MTDHALIRSARPDDLAALPIIERAAASRFRATPYADLADDDPVSAEVDLAHEYVWVVVDPDDEPIGFAIVHLLDESVHLHELDVHPDHARQGLGRRLIATDMHHRGEIIHMLTRLGPMNVLEGDMLSWEQQAQRA